jgi:hypothetical protein
LIISDVCGSIVILDRPVLRSGRVDVMPGFGATSMASVNGSPGVTTRGETSP